MANGTSSSVADWAARTAWYAPIAALFLIGLSERGDALLAIAHIAPARLVVPAGLAALAGIVAGGLALHARRAAGWGDGLNRRAIAGVALSASVVVVIVIAMHVGATSGREAEAAAQRAFDSAMRDYPGWNGGALIDGAGVHASEVHEDSELAKLLVRPYKRPFRVVIFGVDNRAGRTPIILERDGMALAHTSGASTPAESGAPLRVPPGANIDGVAFFFPPTASLRDVRAIEIRVGGTALELPGRYFTLEEKRAIDAARGR